MLWQRTVKKDGTEKWIAVNQEGKPLADADGNYWTRYETRAWAPIYKSKKKNLPDKKFQPEELPDGVDRYTPEGFISAFLLTPEAKKDWNYLEETWKKKRSTSLRHAGCGGGDWPEVASRLPITCPVCGVLPKDATLYAQWQTATKQEGEGVKVCVYEAWLRGQHHEFIAGRVPQGALQEIAAALAAPVRPPAPLDEPRIDSRVDAPPPAKKSSRAKVAIIATVATLLIGAIVILAVLGVVFFLM